VESLAGDQDKHRTANIGCAAMRMGKLMVKIFRIGLVPVRGRRVSAAGSSQCQGRGCYGISDRFWKNRTLTKEVKNEDNT
jgi:hypothetical protein